jgi:hypothetical protein
MRFSTAVLADLTAIFVARYAAFARSWHNCESANSNIRESKLLLQGFTEASDDVGQLLLNFCPELLGFGRRRTNGFYRHKIPENVWSMSTLGVFKEQKESHQESHP